MVGEPDECPPGLLPLSDLARPTAPLPLDKVVGGLRAAVTGVAPQPRYPAPSFSFISDGSSPKLPTAPTAGSVGSLFGLKLYSSASFRRSSSASFRCFLLLQKNSKARTIRATAATGTTTATAILPPADKPPEFFWVLEPVVVAEAALAVVELEAIRDDEDVTGFGTIAEVEVTKIVVAGTTEPSLVVGGCVTVEMIVVAVSWAVVGVTAATVVVVGGADDVEDCGEEELKTEDEVDKIDVVTGCMVLVEGGIEVDVIKVEIDVTVVVEAIAEAATRLVEFSQESIS